MSLSAGVIQTLPKFGFNAISSYFYFLKRVDTLLSKERHLQYLEEASLLLMANKILVSACIQSKKSELLLKKQSKQQVISFLDLQTLNQIEQKKGQILLIQIQANLDITEKKKQKYEELSQFIQVLKNKQNFVYRKTQLIKFQSILRKFIGKLIAESRILQKKWTEQEISLDQKVLIILDFIISILQLNALLIEKNNNWMQFGQESSIHKTKNSPITMSSEILQKIVYKIKFLKLK